MPMYIFALLFISIVTTIVVAAFLLTRKDIVTERLEELRGAKGAPPKKNKAIPLLGGLTSALARLIPPPARLLSRYKTLLMHAGFRGEGSLMFLYGLKLLLTVSLPIAFFLFGFRYFPFNLGVAMTILLAVVGFLGVDFYLSYKARKRQEEIFHNLPDVLDLLAVVVEAGMGIDAAIERVSAEQKFMKTPLALELQQVTREVMVGVPRGEALKNLYERTGLEDIKAFVGMMLQTEKFGTSVSQSLKVFSDSMRTKRRQIAEEAAAKTTIKLVFPLVFLIFPAMFIVIAGPAMINIYKAFFD